jgi:predicted ester cyclase
MSAEQNKLVVRRFIEEAFAKGNLAVVDEIISPDGKEHQESVVPPNAEGVKALIRSIHTAFPDFNCTIEDIVADGDKVWIRLKGTGTHTGPFMGRPPTGRSFTETTFDECVVKDGKIVEHWGVPDMLSVLRQLGLIPLPSQLTRS